MTIAIAPFSGVTPIDGRPLRRRYLRGIRRLGHGALIGIGGMVAAGAFLATVTVVAAWMIGVALDRNPYLHANGPAARSAIAVHHFAPADAGEAVTFEIKWARAMALASTPNGIAAVGPQPSLADASTESATPALQLPPPPEIAVAADATESPEFAAAAVALSAPAPAPPPPAVDPANGIPLPRPYPGKREIARLPAAPPPASAEKRAPTQEAHNRSSAPPDIDSRTAVYDIAAHTVYLPNGERLEAHSGLGDKLDDPRYVRVKNRGPTPPNVYALALREQLFHGVEAIRLKPIDDGKMFGRDGMLAHTYMLGPNGQSNGCVSFRNYSRFLHAFKRGEVDRLVVVARLGNMSWRTAARSAPPRRYADNDR